MIRSRYQVHAEIRRVFTRHWIDLDRITFGEYRGAVRVTGELHFTQTAGWDPSVSILDVLRSQIMRIPEVRYVQFDLLNWSQDQDGQWVEQSARKATPTKEQEQDEDPDAAILAPDGSTTDDG